jgi:iron complex outermembrane receptor protein
MRVFVFIVILVGWAASIKAQFKGVVHDHHGQPIAGVTVLSLPDSVVTVTDKNGQFSSNFRANKLIFSCIGFESLSIDWSPGTKFLEVSLEDDEHALPEISVSTEHSKQEATLSTLHLGERFLEANLDGSFAKSLDKLAGISSINVGVGLAKPVIRGLSSNRVLVNQQDIKMEGQQWGNDHGLEVDQFDVQRFEIVKGPGSLQYGSDALGGVINLQQPILPQNNTIKGQVVGVGKTNNAHLAASFLLEGLLADKFILRARYTQQRFSDVGVPTQKFNYGSFTLPIYNGQLKNTAGAEEDYAFSLGFKTKKAINKLTFSKYSSVTGIFTGAIGAPRAYSLLPDGNDRDIEIPSQEVNHYRLILNQSFSFGEDHLNINWGYQNNQRTERSKPEFHNIPLASLDPNSENFTKATALQLETFSGNCHFEKHASEALKYVIGSNFQYQTNKSSGFEFLIPDFKTLRLGGYGIVFKKFSEQLEVSGGGRLDYAQNQNPYRKQYLYNASATITDSLEVKAIDNAYFNWSASLGASYRLSQVWKLKTNLGKSFRVPYPNETSSNGIHHGNFRHEQGNPDLKTEQGYQFDLVLERTQGKLKGEVAFYFNYFDNFIYLGPDYPARFSPLIGAGQVYLYQQQNAIFSGAELSYSYQLASFLKFEQTADFVQSLNLSTLLALPFTPQPKIFSRLIYNQLHKKYGLVTELSASHQYNFAADDQWRVDRNEKATAASNIFGLGAAIKHLKSEIQLRFEVQNLFNTTYINHMSRYKILNIPEQGFNLIVSLKVPFVARLKTN